MIQLRDTRPSDAEAVAAIYAPAVLTGTASFEEEPPTVAEMARRMADLTGRGFPWLVAEDGGHVVGYAYAGPFRARSAYRFTVEDSVYVAPEAQGRGVGRRLLEALIARCEALGFRQMIGGIGGATPASMALHAACGFHEVGRYEKVGFKFGRWLDVVEMQRALGPRPYTPMG